MSSSNSSSQSWVSPSVRVGTMKTMKTQCALPLLPQSTLISNHDSLSLSSILSPTVKTHHHELKQTELNWTRKKKTKEKKENVLQASWSCLRLAFAWPGHGTFDSSNNNNKVICAHTDSVHTNTNKQSSEFTSTVNSLYRVVRQFHSLRTDHTVVQAGQHYQQINTHATKHTGPDEQKKANSFDSHTHSHTHWD